MKQIQGFYITLVWNKDLKSLGEWTEKSAMADVTKTTAGPPHGSHDLYPGPSGV